jgi:hypothetical protein
VGHERRDRGLQLRFFNVLIVVIVTLFFEVCSTSWSS